MHGRMYWQGMWFEINSLKEFQIVDKWIKDQIEGTKPRSARMPEGFVKRQEEKIKNGAHGMLVNYKPASKDHPLRDNHDDYDEHPK